MADVHKARLQAEIAERTKAAFLSNISHELRTPLAASTGYLQLARDLTEGTAEAVGSNIKKALEHNHRLEETIDDILVMSRIESGKLELELSLVDPLVFKKTLVDRFGTETAEKGLRFEVKIASYLQPFYSDLPKITWISTALVSNAVKFTTEGEVEVEVFDETGSICIRVSDTGCGMTAAQQSDLYTAFHSNLNYLSESSGSNHLGLAIAHSYAVFLNGEIEVVSEVGMGSTLTVRLPKSAEEPEMGQIADLSSIKCAVCRLSDDEFRELSDAFYKADPMTFVAILQAISIGDAEAAGLKQMLERFEYDALMQLFEFRSAKSAAVLS